MSPIAHMTRMREAHRMARRIVAAANKLSRKAQGVAMGWKNICNTNLRQAVTQVEVKLQRRGERVKLWGLFNLGLDLGTYEKDPGSRVTAFKNYLTMQGW